MGVTTLWNIIEHSGTEIYDFEGKTLAVDLSSWICDHAPAANIKKPYLRNIFFRASSLLQNGAKLIFVSEGKAPAIKELTLQHRNEVRHGTMNKASSDATLQRGKLKFISKECERLLSCLGIPHMVSRGEAEATCAYLNYNKVVDGCITDDGDAFLYGAQTVYKDFKVENKSPAATQFDMEKIQHDKQLNRRRLVALALLLGCDYDQTGVPGVGKECAMKLLKQLPDDIDVLERFEEWVSDDSELFPHIDFDLAKRKISHCISCQHPGTDKKHAKSGCSTCSFDKGCLPNNNDCTCDWHKHVRLKNKHGLEIGIREKARTLPEFPNKKLIDEFLNFEDKLPTEQIDWKFPKCKEFIDFMSNTLNWTKEESWERLHPLIAKWQLLAINKNPSLKAINILKKRKHKGLKCLEVEWEFDDDMCKHTFVTVEPRHLVEPCYPGLVALFEPPVAVKEKKTKIRNTRKRDVGNSHKVGNLKPSHTKSKGTQLTLEQMFQNLTVRPTEPEVELYSERVEISSSLCPKLSDPNKATSVPEQVEEDIFQVENEVLLKASDRKEDSSMYSYCAAENISFDVNKLLATPSFKLKDENSLFDKSQVENSTYDDNDLSKDLFPSPAMPVGTSLPSNSLKIHSPEMIRAKFDISLDLSFDASPLPLRERINAKKKLRKNKTRK